jgi:flagellar biosynthesis protein FlhB
MKDYLNFNDLKTAIISILVFFVCLGIQQYWSHHSIKSMKRRIEEAETQKAQLHNLAKSDRAIFIYAFQSLFALVFFVSFAILFSEVMFIAIFLGEMDPRLGGITIAMVWGIALAIAFYSAVVFKRVHDYPNSLETFDKKITKLKEKFLGRK